MLIILLPALGIAGFTVLLPLTAVILAVLMIVSLSCLDVVSVFTKGATTPLSPSGVASILSGACSP